MTMDSTAWLGLVMLAEFGVLALLGMILLQLISWEGQLRDNRDAWLKAMRDRAIRLRRARLQIERVDEKLPSLSAVGGRARKLLMLRTVLRVLLVAKVARS